MRTWGRLAAVLSLASALAFACGGGDDDGASPSPAGADASSEASAPSPAPTVTAPVGVDPPDGGGGTSDAAAALDAGTGDADTSDAAPSDAASDANPTGDAGSDAGPTGPALRAAVTGLTGAGLSLEVEATSTSTVSISAAGTTLLGRYAVGTGYQVRVATQPVGQACHVTKSKGMLAADASVDVACGPLDLLINEVSNCVFANDACWFEVANPSSAPIDLAGYSLRTGAVNRTGGAAVSSQLFALPSLVVPAGGYAIVRGRATDAIIDGPRSVGVLLNGSTVPHWGGSGTTSTGFLELLKGGVTVDFVRFGTSNVAPTTGEWIGGSAIGWPSGSTSYHRGIARTRQMVDTDSAEDWPQRPFPTPAAVNDVTDATDADGDGIPDEAEAPGGTLGGLDLYAMGARQGKKDVFIEIDHMVSTDPGIVPQRASLDLVVAAFAAHDIVIHFDTGALFAAAFDPTAYNLGGGNTVAFAAKIAMSNPPAGVTSTYALKAQHFDIRRNWVFHYLVMANDSADGSGGLGELRGNDLLITLGGLFAGAPNANYAINTQAAAIMHELGHNLGLRHGGNDDVNYKPNYLSVMNYLYANYGLATIGTSEGDRYYLRRHNTLGATCGGVDAESDLFRPRSGTSFVLDYSNGASSPLVESSIDEGAGLGRAGSAAVDYDCSGTTTSGLSLDVNGDNQKTTLTDFDDWANIDVAFGRHVAATDSLSSASSGEPLDPLRDDHQQVIHDPRPRF